ncbi:hypothetical protein NITMOv2_4713 [Nitrospira moscoviensis]|uniref:Uncharacterized protein n=1 Tax=Nitrospira moscoviensis TaxID=42253 RepID=A0A0K2GKC9_NITMO|nr:hypothetical protein NITMOv2_4713 [Nitrospira moscoviensis]
MFISPAIQRMQALTPVECDWLHEGRP